MKGRHTLRIQSAHLRYDMVFTRNLTVIQGDSATGKTTLVDMIQEYLLNGQDTGITLACDCPCRVIAGNTWREQLAGIQDSLVFIDEGNRFVSSADFAEAIHGSGNYYVIVTREALYNLPYSVTEIYGIKSSGKFGTLQPVYHQMYRIYGDEKFLEGSPGSLITEDSNSGYEFFAEVAGAGQIKCVSAGGSGNVFKQLLDIQDERVIVVADGAAFGSQMGKISQLMQRRSGISLYLPESFEWLILSSGILDDSEITNIMKKPYDFVDSRAFFSWERFFTSLLTDKSRGTWLQYSKAKLNPVYLQGKYMQQILSVMPDTIRKELCKKEERL